MSKKIFIVLFLFVFLVLPVATMAESTTFGPYKDIGSDWHNDAGWGFSYQEEGSIFLNINNEIFGPYTSTDEYTLFHSSLTIDKNVWYFDYEKEDGNYIVVNGIEYGPYDNDYYHVASSDNNWGFEYEKNNEYFIVYNSEILGPYTSVDDLVITDNNWGFSSEKDGKEYITINNKEYGPYDDVWYDPFISDNGWAYKYKQDDKWFVNINGKVYMGNIGEHPISKNGISGYSYSQDDGVYIMVNNQSFGPYSSVTGGPEVYDDYWIASIGDHNIVVSGQSYGPYNVLEGYSGTYPKFQSSESNWVFCSMDNNFSETKLCVVNDEEFNFNSDYRMFVNGDNWSASKLDVDNNTGKMTFNEVVNGKDYGKHGLTINDIGGEFNEKVWYSAYSELNKEYLLVNDQVFGPFDVIDDVRVQGNRWWFIYENIKQIGENEHQVEKYVNILGENYGPYSADSYFDVSDNYLQITSGNNSKRFIEVYKYGVADIKKSESDMIVITNKDLYARLGGKIVLKIEDKGKAYYIHPENDKMYYLGKPRDAFSVMREQGVGISSFDLKKIPVGLVRTDGLDTDHDGLSDLFEDAIGTDKNKQDTDGDGYDDLGELESNFNPNGINEISVNVKFAEKQKGKIFLQVEKNGEAWYINPADGKRYFLGRPADAFNVMRNLGLGISNENFVKL